jgi:hypothetical protein
MNIRLMSTACGFIFTIKPEGFLNIDTQTLSIFDGQKRGRFPLLPSLRPDLVQTQQQQHRDQRVLDG